MASLGSRFLDILRLRSRSLFRRGRVEHELDDELRFHFESVVDRYIAGGMGEADARRRARLEYGGTEQIKEECRDMRGVGFVENVVRDAVYAIRGFQRDKTFAALAIATIALAVGVNTGLFTLVYSLLFRPLPVSDPGSLRNVYIRKHGEARISSYGSRHFASFNELTHIRAHAGTAEVAGVATGELSWKGHREPVRAQLVSDNLLPMLGGKPVLGRFIAREEASSPGSAPVVVLSYAAWQKHFGGARDVVGRPMILNRTMFTVVGVADENTTGPLVTRPDAWIPLTMQALTRPGEPLVTDPQANWIQLIARRRPGVTDAQIQSEMAVLGQQAIAPFTPKNTVAVTISPAALLNLPEVFNEGLPIVAVLFIAVTLVLLLACANVANMLLARGMNRRREIAIRLAIGSGRRRLLQQLLVESMLLGIAAGMVGLLLANVSVGALLALIPESEIGAHQLDLAPDAAVLLYTLAVSLLTGVVFGLLPAVNSLRLDLTPALKTEGLQSAGGSRRMWLQNSLIGVQVAGCVVLLASAGLLLRGLQSALHLDIGVPVKNVLIASMDFRQQQYTGERAARILNTARDTVSALPGVNAAALTAMNPLVSESYRGAKVILSDGSAGPNFQIKTDETDPNFFAAMKIAVLQGRPFTSGEYASGARVTLIDEDLARTHFKNQNPIGRRLRLGDSASDDHEIIGVVSNRKALEVDSRPAPRAYIPLVGLRFVESRLLVNYSGPRIEVARAVERAVTGLDSGLTVRTAGIEDNVSNALMPVKMAAAAASALGVLALILACTGLYGVVSFAVSRRRREVGIRLALGAAKRDVLTLLLRQGLTPVAIGALIGVALAAGAAQIIEALLYGVSPIDPIAFGATLLILAAVAGIAAFVPASAALSVDPSITLRHD
jgi:predicted permease